MKVGTIGYDCESGLGNLVKSFYDNEVVTDIFVIKHSHWPSKNWYPDAPSCPARILNVRAMERFCLSVDVMLFFETPFAWELIPYCRTYGIKTFMMPMYECMPKELPYQPDRFINPSALDQQFYPDRSVHIPVPVNVPWRLREKALTFVHNAGHFGLKNRNGTIEVLRALPLVKSPIRLIVRAQDDRIHERLAQVPEARKDPRLEVFVGNVPYEQLWTVGDVFLFPEKFNGLSLPLQESFASGMCVMATDRFPNNTYLPNTPLIKSYGQTIEQLSGRLNQIKSAIVDPQDVAFRIDDFYGDDITEYSFAGRDFAKQLSWEALKPIYLKELAR